MYRSSDGFVRGFSLIELLVALSVTSSIVALMFVAFGSIGKTEQRNSLSMERAQRMLSVSQWLGRKLEGLRQVSRRDGVGFSIFFNGNAAGAMWIAPLPERGESGGLHVIRLTPHRHTTGRVEWIAEALPYDGLITPLDWNVAARETLMSQVSVLQWHYQDGKTGAWSQVWDSSRGVYPTRIRIELGDDRGAWPDLIFSLSRAR